MQLDYGTKLVICILVMLALTFIGLIWFRHSCSDHGYIGSPNNDILTYEAPEYKGPDSVDTFETFAARVNGAGSPSMWGGGLKKRVMQWLQ